MRSKLILRLLLLALPFVFSLDGCKGTNQTSGEHKQQEAADSSSAIRTVRSLLAAKLRTVHADPSDRSQTMRAMDSYASAYSDVNITECPTDFRQQFYLSRQAWVVSATALQEEALYLQQNSNHDVARGGRLSIEAAMLAQNSASVMQNAMSQDQELGVIARKYGIDWNFSDQD